jgi:NAD(P)-dependent dehydrogenase (short-subunit alcohol dehydrogenase family)
MRAGRYGKIVNIGSLAAQQGRPTTSPAYPASKGAVLGLTVSLARHLAEFGICVNAINPGFIRTEIHDRFTAEQLRPLTADIPLARRGVPGAGGLPQDIAGAVLFLLSPDSDFVTGEFLSVNGGSRTG